MEKIADFISKQYMPEQNLYSKRVSRLKSSKTRKELYTLAALVYQHHADSKESLSSDNFKGKYNINDYENYQ